MEAHNLGRPDGMCQDLLIGEDRLPRERPCIWHLRSLTPKGLGGGAELNTEKREYNWAVYNAEAGSA